MRFSTIRSRQALPGPAIKRSGLIASYSTYHIHVTAEKLSVFLVVCPGLSLCLCRLCLCRLCLCLSHRLVRLCLRLRLDLLHHVIPVAALARPVFWCVARPQGSKRSDDDTQTDDRHRE